jgi:hypothetical protein
MGQVWDSRQMATIWAEEDIIRIRGQLTTSEYYNILR